MAARGLQQHKRTMPQILSVIEKYLTARYKDGARGEDGQFDCWGMCRAARVELYGRQLLDSRGGEYQHDPKGFTERYREQIAEMTEVESASPGVVVAVLRKKIICTHVALVVHDINNSGMGLHILDINPKRGPRLFPLFRFLEENKLRTIKYYDDKSLPKSP